MRWLLVAALAGLVPATAQAAHCRHGQIWRVHLHECVSRTSALARPYVYRAHYTAFERPHRFQRIKVHCDPLSMCGDPVSDRVIDEPPADLPDAFAHSRMTPIGNIYWRLP